MHFDGTKNFQIEYMGLGPDTARVQNWTSIAFQPWAKLKQVHISNWQLYKSSKLIPAHALLGYIGHGQ